MLRSVDRSLRLVPLCYGREIIVDACYTARLYGGCTAARSSRPTPADRAPRYNRDRGPIAIGQLRLHFEL